MLDKALRGRVRLTRRRPRSKTLLHVIAVHRSECCNDFYLLISIMGCCMGMYQRESNEEMAAASQLLLPRTPCNYSKSKCVTP